MTPFRTLSQALQETVGDARVTHALFTSYAFEVEFFEANIVPLLLGPLEGMSLHDGVRRLQLNEKLCAMPDEARPRIEVFVDEAVAKTGVPWLPYSLHAVRTPGAFHGKVILLRLESNDGKQSVKWVLGCGSANLTLAGWWENVETWHFTAPFSAQNVPANVFEDLAAMLAWLRGVASSHRHPVLDAWDADAPRVSKQSPKQTAGPRFTALLAPSHDRFVGRFIYALGDNPDASERRELEVVSPYFCEKNHGDFADEVNAALSCTALRVWLPIDVWSEGAGLLTKAQFGEPYASRKWQWAALTKRSSLRDAATPEAIHSKPRRVTHAKVIRVPGQQAFIGSVNFSRAAFDINFEAGFFFEDNDVSWLDTTDAAPPSFLLDNTGPGENEGQVSSEPTFDATFDWKTSILTVRFGANCEPRFVGATLAWRNPASSTTQQVFADQPVCDAALFDNFRNQPTVDIDWSLSATERGTAGVWAHQENLDWRPIPEELKLDVWSMIDLWRSTEGNRIGGSAGVWQRIVSHIELQQAISPDAPESASQHEDIFARMTHIHGAFQRLREQIQQPDMPGDAIARKREELARYYLCTERTDSLRTMLAKIETEIDTGAFDEIERWVVLHWIKQIAKEHPGIGDPVAGIADALIETLRSTRLESVPKDKLDWLSQAFLGELDRRTELLGDTETEPAYDAP